MDGEGIFLSYLVINFQLKFAYTMMRLCKSIIS